MVTFMSKCKGKIIPGSAPIGAVCVSDIPFPVALAYKGSGQFFPLLPYFQPSRNLVYSQQWSGLGVLSQITDDGLE